MLFWAVERLNVLMIRKRCRLQPRFITLHVSCHHLWPVPSPSLPVSRSQLRWTNPFSSSLPSTTWTFSPRPRRCPRRSPSACRLTSPSVRRPALQHDARLWFSARTLLWLYGEYFCLFSPQWWSIRLPTWDTLNTTWRPRSMKRLPKRFPGARRGSSCLGLVRGDGGADDLTALRFLLLPSEF